MILQRNADGTYTLSDGSVIDEATYLAQLTDEEKAQLNPPAPQNNDSQESFFRMRNLILEEENRRLQALRNPAPQPQAPPPIPQLEPGALFNNPNQGLEIIQKMIKDQVAPLHDFMNNFSQQQAYGTKKAQIRQQFPAFAAIEGLVDQYMTGKAPTDENLQEAIQRAVGAAALQNPAMFSSPTANPTPAPKPAPVNNPPTNPNNPVPVNNMLPPHLRPSNPTAPNQPSKTVDMSQFDENQKRLMRENGQGPNEYLLFLNTPSNELTQKSFVKKLEAARKADRGE